MIVKIQRLTNNVHIARGYRHKNDIKYCFVCTLYRDSFFKTFIKRKLYREWSLVAMMSRGGTVLEIKQVIDFLKCYPYGYVYTYVSALDLKRFYKRHCFGKVEFKNCKEI